MNSKVYWFNYNFWNVDAKLKILFKVKSEKLILNLEEFVTKLNHVEHLYCFENIIQPITFKCWNEYFKKNKTSVTLFFGRNAKVRGELPLQYAMSRMGGAPGPDDDTKVLYPELVPSLVSRVGTGEQGWSCDSWCLARTVWLAVRNVLLSRIHLRPLNNTMPGLSCTYSYSDILVWVYLTMVSTSRLWRSIMDSIHMGSIQSHIPVPTYELII